MTDEKMLIIDGSQGEGGGQVLRSSLALALVTGRAFTLENVRAGRKKPGLLKQHLAGVRAATQVGTAKVVGDQLGSKRLEFYPGKVQPGDYTFRVGSAGSATLVLQTVLPALMLADQPSRLTLEGGTHNSMAPPFDFLVHAYLPLVNRLGPQIQAVLERPGFYPAGGGRFTVEVQPAKKWERLDLTQRGPVVRRRVRALVAQLPRHIAERECQTIAALLKWNPEAFAIEELRNSVGPGNVVMIEAGSADVTEVFTGFGQRGIKAEQVAQQAAQAALEYLNSTAVVGEYLADQLLLPLALSSHCGGPGGRFLTLPLSSHSTTHLSILRLFLSIPLAIHFTSGSEVLVEVGSG